MDRVVNGERIGKGQATNGQVVLVVREHLCGRRVAVRHRRSVLGRREGEPRNPAVEAPLFAKVFSISSPLKIPERSGGLAKFSKSVTSGTKQLVSCIKPAIAIRAIIRFLRV